MALSKITNTGINNITVDSSGLDVASSNATIHLTDTDDTTYAEIRNNGGTFTIASDEGAAATNSSINFRVDSTERMRIDSSGNLLVGSTSAIGKLTVISDQAYASSFRVRANGELGANWQNASGVQVGYIQVNASSTTYSTVSDYRLKENVTADWDATTRLKQLNPVRFNFIADADTTVDGFLAHEVQDIVPEAISGIKDAVDDEGNPLHQGIDQSKLVPLLVKTIQELEARITALEAN